MSLHYLLDGYNILHQMELPNNLKLEDQRERLIRAVELYHPQGSTRNKVTIVFDGKYGIYGGHRPAEVQVIFSQDESADDVIVRIVERSGNKKIICVVTNDRAIGRAVKDLGADVMAVDEFVSRLSRDGSSKPKKISGKKADAVKSISSSTEHKINKELRDLWLDKKKPDGRQLG